MPAPAAPAAPLSSTLANFTPSAPTWICSLLAGFLIDKPSLFRVVLSPALRPLVVLMPKVTVPSLLVATVRPFSPLNVRVLTALLPFAFLPTVMVSSTVAPSFLTLKVCRAVSAVPLVV